VGKPPKPTPFKLRKKIARKATEYTKIYMGGGNIERQKSQMLKTVKSKKSLFDDD
jgi:hypothetical protein